MSQQTLTLQEVVGKLAAQLNCDEQLASDFIRELSAAITHGLSTEGFVTIDAIGTFRTVTDMDGTPTVEFAPASTLASAINEPFAIFEPVELAETMTDEEVAAQPVPPPIPEKYKAQEISTEIVPNSNIQEPGEAIETAREPAASVEEPAEDSVDDSVEEPVEKSIETDQAEPPQEDTSLKSPLGPERVEEAPAIAAKPATDETQLETARNQTRTDAPTEEYSPSRCESARKGPLPVLLEPESHVTVKRVGHTTLTLLLAAVAALLLGLVIGGILGFILHDGIVNSGSASADPTTDINTPEIASPDTLVVETIETVDTDTVTTPGISSEEPAVVTDTVGPGNYLSIMAKRHYGNPKFWVYIYLENKDVIRDPDNLENGMVLIIPPAEKYGIDPSSKESIEKAQKEAYRVSCQ